MKPETIEKVRRLCAQVIDSEDGRSTQGAESAILAEEILAELPGGSERHIIAERGPTGELRTIHSVEELERDPSLYKPDRIFKIDPPVEVKAGESVTMRSLHSAEELKDAVVDAGVRLGMDGGFRYDDDGNRIGIRGPDAFADAIAEEFDRANDDEAELEGALEDRRLGDS